MSKRILTGTLLDDQLHLSLIDISEACASRTEWVIELVEEGILEPLGEQRDQWRFPGESLSRANTARRLQRDLGLNLAGVALVLDLLEEIETLRARLRNQELQS